MNDGGRNVESSNGQLVAAKLLDSSLIIFAALLGSFFGIAALIGAIGFIARNKEEGEIDENADKDEGGIEIGILEKGFRWRRLRVHKCRELAPNGLDGQNTEGDAADAIGEIS